MGKFDEIIAFFSRKKLMIPYTTPVMFEYIHASFKFGKTAERNASKDP